MTVQDLIAMLTDLVNGPHGEHIRRALVTAEAGNGHRVYDVARRITHPLRYTPDGLAVLTLDLILVDGGEP